MNFSHVAILVLLFYSSSLIGDDSLNPSCKADKRVVAPCFKVHGRLSNWNGNPTRRIWIIGTKRILGVREDTDFPKALKDMLGDFDDVAVGDFEACPFKRQQQGRMQIVCIAAVSRIRMSRRP